jgi:hypothetical protein
MNNNLKIGGIFCDLQKAFGCVDHNILMKKLEFYGIEGKFKTLIISYLTNRHQKVALNNNTDINSSSKWEMTKSGVPQGSILGPLFFLLYINDLPKIVTKNNSMVLFADDTSLLITGLNKLNLNTNINQAICSIISWFNSNLLTLNFSKTHYVEFRTKNYYQAEMSVNPLGSNVELRSTVRSFARGPTSSLARHVILLCFLSFSRSSCHLLCAV